MARCKWKLTLAAIGDEPEIDEWGDGEPVFGLRIISLLKALAEDPANGLVEIAPGVYRGPPVP
jgi:hypothetical protein